MPPVPNKEITPLKEDLSLHSNQKTPPMRGKSSNEVNKIARKRIF